MTSVLVPASRLPRWIENFGGRHGETALSVVDGRLHGSAVDGASFIASLPFSRTYDGDADPAAFAEEASPPPDWGILLVRKGGFAVARLAGTSTVESKVGQRHVQGRTKAGGQSQQRFARRRDNQARAAYEAAAGHADRIVADVRCLVVGGDDTAIRQTLEDPRLSAVSDRIVGEFLTVPDPRRSVLEEAILDAASLSLVVDNG